MKDFESALLALLEGATLEFTQAFVTLLAKKTAGTGPVATVSTARVIDPAAIASTRI